MIRRLIAKAAETRTMSEERRSGLRAWEDEMRVGRLAAIAFAALLAVCPAAGAGEPTPRAVAALTKAGFTPEPFAMFNRALSADSIVTTGNFSNCARIPCRSVTSVHFGRQTDASGEWRKDLDAILATRGRLGVPAENRIMRAVALDDQKMIGSSSFAAASGGRGYTLDFTGKIAEFKTFWRMTIIYDGAEARVVMAYGDKRDTARRFGGREMLE
jgi:hypothetical protein